MLQQVVSSAGSDQKALGLRAMDLPMFLGGLLLLPARLQAILTRLLLAVCLFFYASHYPEVSCGVVRSGHVKSQVLFGSDHQCPTRMGFFRVSICSW